MPKVNKKQARKNPHGIQITKLSKKVEELKVIVKALRKENAEVHEMHRLALYTVLTLIEGRLLSE